MDLEVIGTNPRNWVDSAQNSNYWRSVVNAALNLRIPYAMESVSAQTNAENAHIEMKGLNCVKQDFNEGGRH
jgi:hypothetical protein